MSSSVAFNVIVNWPTSDLSLHFHNAVSLDLHKNVFKPVPLIAAPSALFTIVLIVFERTKHKLTFDLKLLEIFYQNLFYKALLPWWTA